MALIGRALDETAGDTLDGASGETGGDVLAFLPGAGEIGRAAARLRSERPGLELAELHGSLPFARQRAVLAPRRGRRRVVLATSIAETSLTVPGVRVVVDTGLARRARTDPGTGLSRLVTVPVSRAEADQRRGRAGRLGPGVCYRMWTKGEEGGLPAFAPPEILEADLAPLALELALWGAAPEALRWLDPPPAAAFEAARGLLADLGALDDAGRITAHGRALAAEPLHPRLAHMVVRARGRGEGTEAALLAALLSERDPLRAAGADLRDRLRAVSRGDPAADAATIARIRAEAARIAGGAAMPHRGASNREGGRAERLAGALAAAAYPDRVALRRPGGEARYLLSGGRGAWLDAGDPLAGERLLVATDLEDGPEARIRVAAPIAEAELREVLSDRLRWAETVELVRPGGARRGAPARDAGGDRAVGRALGGAARPARRRARRWRAQRRHRRPALAEIRAGPARPGRLAAPARRAARRHPARLVGCRAAGEPRRLADAASRGPAAARRDRPARPRRYPARRARLGLPQRDRPTGARARRAAARARPRWTMPASSRPSRCACRSSSA